MYMFTAKNRYKSYIMLCNITRCCSYEKGAPEFSGAPTCLMAFAAVAARRALAPPVPQQAAGEGAGGFAVLEGYFAVEHGVAATTTKRPQINWRPHSAGEAFRWGYPPSRPPASAKLRFFAALQHEPRLALPGATVPATCVFGPMPKTTS